MTNINIISGNIVDVVNRNIFKGEITIKEGKIEKIERKEEADNCYILPGLIDAHVHIESSMLVPSRFAELAVKHGTVATVSDPHEIANVLGIKGVEFMIDDSKKIPLKIFFGAPSCVPATSFETTGFAIGAKETEELLKREDIYYLSEMMNYPAVIFGDKEVAAKIEISKKYNKPIDGHAPAVRGDDLLKYVTAGISTDHECTTYEEAEEKIKAGMKILIREGSAAKNYKKLASLIKHYPEKIMFCTDDSHPDDLETGHIDKIIRRALSEGYDPIMLIRAATYNPVKHYNIPVGLLQEGDSGDIVIVDNLIDFNVKTTYINGQKVFDNNSVLFEYNETEEPNNFFCNELREQDILVENKGKEIKIIEAQAGELVTGQINMSPKLSENGFIMSDTERDILKIVVQNRYEKAPPVCTFIRGFGLKKGAIASSIAHDSHNIIAVGTNDKDIVRAINLINENKGGIVAVNEKREEVLALPVAGLMSVDKSENVAKKYKSLNKFAGELGSVLSAPFMTLSFMALLVIPSLKISDKGLFDGDKFQFTSLYIN